MHPGISITVVVVAYNRKQYLLDAVNSVRSGRNNLEIIVVTGFEDVEINAELDARGIKHFTIPGDKNGERILTGIKASSNDVISFLEDDDRFLPEKIDRISDIFAENTNLAYFENSYLLIDESGKRVAGREWIINNRKNLCKTGDIFIDELPLHDPDMKVLRKANCGMNLSCITIRKSLYGDKLEMLANAFMNVDLILLRLSHSMNLAIGFGSTPLTEYRLHSNQTSTAMANKGSFKVFKEQMLPIMTKQISDINLALSVSVERNRHILFMWKRELKLDALNNKKLKIGILAKHIKAILEYDDHPFLSIVWRSLYAISSQIPLFIEFINMSRHLELKL
jgi:glycosyltransferase involved in cell wall biosynthesis